jgi:hypothetical protein
MSVIPLKDFCPTDVVFTKKMASQTTGRYFCFVNSVSGSSKWLLQTPVMLAPFGVSQGPESGNDNKPNGGDMKLTLSFGGDDPELEMCRQKLTEFQEFVLQYAVDNSQEWFGKPMTREVVESMYFPNIRKDPKMQWADNFTVKIPSSMHDGKVQLDKLYSWDPDSDTPSMTEIPPDEILQHIVRRTRVQVIFTLSQVYFTGSRGFGVSLKAHVVRFVPQSSQSDISFLDSTPVTITTAPTDASLDCDSDDTDDEDENEKGDEDAL